MAPLSAPPNVLQRDPRYYRGPGYGLPSDGSSHQQSIGQEDICPPHPMTASMQGMLYFQIIFEKSQL